MDKEKFLEISPIDPTRQDKRFAIEEFIEKARPFLPHFPDDVLEQWVYENFSIFSSEDRWEIGYDRLRFSEVMITSEMVWDIYDLPNYYDAGIGYAEICEKTLVTMLSDYMLANGTWPRPIIVLDTENSNADGEYEYLRPYHLLEGHRRLVYLKRMLDSGLAVQEHHTIWKVIRV
ncbi:MAG: hypothetical protein IJE54_01250 [Peptococcaceae bacterium]|nr:hypothetical protein [Peptococcaceae bacterium]MBQ3510252.1 hypothetical protein [Peptococcaceae bacterium]MBQ6887061.1 hypothetical protein [Lachnospiraceae bacterium]